MVAFQAISLPSYNQFWSFGLLFGHIHQCLNLPIKFRKPSGNDHGTTVFHKTMGTLPQTNNLPSHAHGIGKLKLEVLHVTDGHLNLNDILEGCGMLVVTVDADHWRHHTFSLDAIEAVAQLVEVVHASLFHNTNVVGMVRDAHPVTFVILDFVFIWDHTYIKYPCLNR